MNGTVLKIGKIVVQVLSIGTTLAAGYFANKDLDAKVARKVAEAFAESAKKGS